MKNIRVLEKCAFFFGLYGLDFGSLVWLETIVICFTKLKYAANQSKNNVSHKNFRRIMVYISVRFSWLTARAFMSLLFTLGYVPVFSVSLLFVKLQFNQWATHKHPSWTLNQIISSEVLGYNFVPNLWYYEREERERGNSYLEETATIAHNRSELPNRAGGGWNTGEMAQEGQGRSRTRSAEKEGGAMRYT